MDIYRFNIGDVSYEVKILSLKKDTAEVEVNGETFTIDIDDIGSLPSVVSNVVAQKAQEASNSPVRAPKSPLKVVKQAASKNDITAPMPGLIVKVFVKPGDFVSAGDILVTIEAMKMENQIKATTDGVVTKIHVNQGDSIAEGQALMSLGGE